MEGNVSSVHPQQSLENKSKVNPERKAAQTAKLDKAFAPWYIKMLRSMNTRDAFTAMANFKKHVTKEVLIRTTMAAARFAIGPADEVASAALSVVPHPNKEIVATANEDRPQPQIVEQRGGVGDPDE